MRGTDNEEAISTLLSRMGGATYCRGTNMSGGFMILFCCSQQFGFNNCNSNTVISPLVRIAHLVFTDSF